MPCGAIAKGDAHYPGLVAGMLPREVGGGRGLVPLTFI